MKSEERIIRGVVASPGVALGTPSGHSIRCLFHSTSNCVRIK